MTVAEKIVEIGKNFQHPTLVVYVLNRNNSGRIVDFAIDMKEARSYVEIGRKNGLDIHIAEYNPETKVVCYDFN